MQKTIIIPLGRMRRVTAFVAMMKTSSIRAAPVTEWEARCEKRFLRGDGKMLKWSEVGLWRHRAFIRYIYSKSREVQLRLFHSSLLICLLVVYTEFFSLTDRMNAYGQIVPNVE